jgi:frataxin-like iron-binding protein CyaY
MAVTNNAGSNIQNQIIEEQIRQQQVQEQNAVSPTDNKDNLQTVSSETQTAPVTDAGANAKIGEQNIQADALKATLNQKADAIATVDPSIEIIDGVIVDPTKNPNTKPIDISNPDDLAKLAGTLKTDEPGIPADFTEPRLGRGNITQAYLWGHNNTEKPYSNGTSAAKETLANSYVFYNASGVTSPSQNVDTKITNDVPSGAIVEHLLRATGQTAVLDRLSGISAYNLVNEFIPQSQEEYYRTAPTDEWGDALVPFDRNGFLKPVVDAKVDSTWLKDYMNGVGSNVFAGVLSNLGTSYQPIEGVNDAASIQPKMLESLDSLRKSGDFNDGDMYRIARSILNTEKPREGMLRDVDKLFSSNKHPELIEMWEKGLGAAVIEKMSPKTQIVASNNLSGLDSTSTLNDMLESKLISERSIISERLMEKTGYMIAGISENAQVSYGVKPETRDKSYTRKGFEYEAGFIGSRKLNPKESADGDEGYGTSFTWVFKPKTTPTVGNENVYLAIRKNLTQNEIVNIHGKNYSVEGLVKERTWAGEYKVEIRYTMIDDARIDSIIKESETLSAGKVKDTDTYNFPHPVLAKNYLEGLEAKARADGIKEMNWEIKAAAYDFQKDNVILQVNADGKNVLANAAHTLHEIWLNGKQVGAFNAHNKGVGLYKRVTDWNTDTNRRVFEARKTDLQELGEISDHLYKKHRNTGFGAPWICQDISLDIEKKMKKGNPLAFLHHAYNPRVKDTTDPQKEVQVQVSNEIITSLMNKGRTFLPIIMGTANPELEPVLLRQDRQRQILELRYKKDEKI